jgi:phenylalanyl-tRNA synthetase alpha subunit
MSMDLPKFQVLFSPVTLSDDTVTGQRKIEILRNLQQRLNVVTIQKMYRKLKIDSKNLPMFLRFKNLAVNLCFT